MSKINSIDIKTIYADLIHNKDRKKLKNYEKELTERIKNTNTNSELEELYFLLLVTKIENSYVENARIKQLLVKYFSILDKLEVSKKYKKSRLKIINKRKDYWIIIFYNTMISRLHFLERLYKKNYSSDYNVSIRRVKFEYKKNLYLEEKNFWWYLSYVWYKWMTWYWDWIENLAFTSFFVLMLFSYIYYIYDLLHPWTLNNWFPWMEWIGLSSFEYYIYLSTNIFSNLWADWNLAITPFLRVLFGIEQILWVLLFWLFIFIMWKKL